MQAETRRTIAEALGLDAERARARPLGGGDIAASYRLEDGAGCVFVKCMPPEQRAVLEAEQDGLTRIAATNTIRVPSVLAAGCDEVCWLALEFLDLAPCSHAAFTELGERLAGMHAHRSACFGLARDNFIGATPQINRASEDWTEFFFEYRIGDQIRRLSKAGKRFDQGDTDKLRAAWERRFPGYAPATSLIHGDLWAGNAAMIAGRQPVIFDPAVHHADRECDLAMTRLFGGFGTDFYDAYEEAWPLEAGWRERLGFYQLYHVLNHANLFGGGYLGQSRRLIDELAGE